MPRLLLALVLALAPSLATAADRVALVIGNGAYQHATELANPANDAEAIASALDAIGFEVIKGIDLDRAGMERALRDYVGAIEDAEIALFYYAGHGLQVDGRNYLVPVDAALEDRASLDFEMIEADKVFGYMGGNDRIALAFLDACRDNPLSRRLARTLGATRSGGIGAGLAQPQTAGTGLFIGFSTAPGDVAADGKGENSPFTEAILRHIATPGLEINQVMTRVKADVRAMTDDDQRPWTNSDLATDVYLVPAGAEAPRVAALPVESPDEQHWRVIADSGVAAVFEEFIQRYPGSPRRGDAEARLAALAPRDTGGDRIADTRRLALGEWRGSYTCAQGETGLTLTIEPRGQGLVGRWSFYPLPTNPRVPEGLAEFELLVSTDGTLRSGRATWIERPAGYGAMPFSGTISTDGRVFEGDVAGCRTFRVERVEDRVASLAPADDVPCAAGDRMASTRIGFSMCLDRGYWADNPQLQPPAEFSLLSRDGVLGVSVNPEVTVCAEPACKQAVIANLEAGARQQNATTTIHADEQVTIGGRTWGRLEYELVAAGVAYRFVNYRFSQLGIGSVQVLFISTDAFADHLRTESARIMETVGFGDGLLGGLAPVPDTAGGILTGRHLVPGKSTVLVGPDEVPLALLGSTQNGMRFSVDGADWRPWPGQSTAIGRACMVTFLGATDTRRDANIWLSCPGLGGGTSGALGSGTHAIASKSSVLVGDANVPLALLGMTQNGSRFLADGADWRPSPGQSTTVGGCRVTYLGADQNRRDANVRIAC